MSDNKIHRCDMRSGKCPVCARTDKPAPVPVPTQDTGNGEVIYLLKFIALLLLGILISLLIR